MKSLLFLGAGASTQFNEIMPVEKTFFYQYKNQRPKIVNAKGVGFDKNNMPGLQHPEIEKQFDHADLIGISNLYASIDSKNQSYLLQLLERFISTLVMKGFLYPPKEHYKALMDFVANSGVGIATTNWDLCVESCLEERYDHGGVTDNKVGLPLWKLQGSLSWQIPSHRGGESRGASLQIGLRLKPDDSEFRVLSASVMKSVLEKDMTSMGVYSEPGLVFRPFIVCYSEREIGQLPTIRAVHDDFLSSIAEVENLVTIGYRYPKEDVEFLKNWKSAFKSLRYVHNFVNEFGTDPKEYFNEKVNVSAPLGYFTEENLNKIKELLLDGADQDT